MKKISILLISLFIFLFCSKNTFALEKYNSDSLIKKISNKVSVNESEITLYYLSSDAKDAGVNIPDNLNTSFKIEVSGTNIVPEYVVSYEDSYYLKVSDDGVVTLNKLVEDNGAFEMSDLTANIIVRVANEDIPIKINIKDYLNTYVKNIMQNFIAENIKDTMSDYEKVETIAKYLLNYEYTTNPNFRYVFINGGGDCIALNSIFIQMCKMIGIDAHQRYAGDIFGNNHYDSVVLIDNEIYYVDVSYHDPRDYTISKSPFGFMYDGGFFFVYDNSDTSNLILKKYSGFDTDNITIPASYKKEDKVYNVKTIATNSFRHSCTISGVNVKSVIIPEGVETIEKDAFSGCSDLEYVKIPSTVNNIDPEAFTEDYGLKQIEIEENNETYSYKDGVIYNKDETEVVLVLPSKEGELELSSKVETIKPYAFSIASNLTGVVLGENVKTIESHAFDHAQIYGITIPKSVTNIESKAFYEATFRYIKFEDGSDISLYDYMFEGCINLNALYIPQSIKDIGTNVLNLANKKATLYVNDNSSALDFAKSNSMDYEIANKNSIVSEMIVLKNISYSYDGLSKEPEVIVLDGGKILKENIDYTKSYSNNINANTTSSEPTVTVTGMNSYSGSANKTFTINKSLSDVSVDVKDVTYGETPNPILIENNAGSKYTDISYNTSKTLTGATKTPPTEVGEYYVNLKVVVPKNTNYGTRSLWAKFNILKANNDFAIEANDINFGESLNIKVTKNKSGGDVTYYYKRASLGDDAYSLKEPQQPGSYSVKAVSSETKNYNEATAYATFKIIGDISYLRGDLTRNGSIEVSDATEALLKTIEELDTTEEDLLIADFDENGKINASDATEILLLYINGDY